MPAPATDMAHSSDVAVGTPPALPKFTSKVQERAFLKFRLAQAFRIFGKLGYDEGVAGHITVRDPIRTDCFWVNPFGKHFSMIQPNDLILVDKHSQVQAAESGPNRLLNKAAFMIHAAIHEARPDVHCAAHSHSVYGRAFSTLGKPLTMITQDSCAFYDDHAVYNQYGGLVLGEEEGAKIAETLGPRKAAILQNHGLLVATGSVEATVHFFITLEKTCQVQLLAEAAGKPLEIPGEDAAKVRDVTGTNYAGWFSGKPLFELMEQREGVSFDWDSRGTDTLKK
ncbi:class II aldolase/adducin domain-containing protein [Trametes gibbosa]|nr:class II aldolase/adducin domain-containing protein [Trametes gibbosa]